jgi:hypothetical protein
MWPGSITSVISTAVSAAPAAVTMRARPPSMSPSAAASSGLILSAGRLCAGFPYETRE